MTAEGTIVAKRARHTRAEEGGWVVLQRLIELAEELLEGAEEGVAGIGVATPGIVDSEKGRIRFVSTELPGWSDQPIAQTITQRLGLPVLVDNDGRAAALAEHRLGVGRGCANFVALVLGTGVGGGVVANNALVRGSHGGGGRLGHIGVATDGPLCTCGNRGCLELYASGPALAQAAEVALDAGRQSLLCRKDAQGSRTTLTGRDVVEAALDGDSLAQDVIRAAGQRLGQAAVQLNRILDPDRIAVGGSISTAGDLMFDPAREYVREHSPEEMRASFDIVRARFGRDASVVGAALLGWETSGQGTEVR
jgi:glucokinase